MINQEIDGTMREIFALNSKIETNNKIVKNMVRYVYTSSGGIKSTLDDNETDELLAIYCHTCGEQIK